MVSSIITGIITGLKDGISGLLKKLFVVEGNVTETDKPENKKDVQKATKKTLKERIEDDYDTVCKYVSNKWDNLCNATEKAYDAVCAAGSAAYSTAKELFWDGWVRKIENTKATYKKYWNALKKQFDPKKEKDYTKDLQKKKEKIKINLTQFASAIPGYDVLVEVKDVLMELAEFVGDYKDPFDTSNDPTAAIKSMIDLINNVVNAFNPFKDIGASIPSGWNETLQCLEMLLEVNAEADKKCGGLKKNTKFRWPEMPTEFKNVYEVASSAFSSIGKKSFMFIFWIIFKCFEAVVKLFELLGLDIIPPLNLISSCYKLVLAGWELFTNGPLAIKNIFQGIGLKLMGIVDGSMFSEFPDQIEFEAFGFDLGGVESEVPTQETLNELEAEKGTLEAELEVAKQDLANANYEGSTTYDEAKAKVEELNNKLDDINSEIADTKQIVYENNKTINDTVSDMTTNVEAANKELTAKVDALKSEQQELQTKVASLTEEYDSYSTAAKNGYGVDAGKAYNCKQELDAATLQYDTVTKSISTTQAEVDGKIAENNSYLESSTKALNSAKVDTYAAEDYGNNIKASKLSTYKSISTTSQPVTDIAQQYMSYNDSNTTKV